MIGTWILIFVGSWVYNVPASNLGEFYSQTSCEVAKKGGDGEESSIPIHLCT